MFFTQTQVNLQAAHKSLQAGHKHTTSTRVTPRSGVEFTAWRAVGRPTQVPKGRGAKRGELRWVVRARAWPPRCPRRAGCRSLKGAGWCRLMHGWYGHDAGPTGGRLLLLSGTQAPWQVELQACRQLSGSSRKSRTPWGPAPGHHSGRQNRCRDPRACSVPSSCRSVELSVFCRTQQTKISRRRSAWSPSRLHVGMGRSLIRSRAMSSTLRPCWIGLWKATVESM